MRLVDIHDPVTEKPEWHSSPSLLNAKAWEKHCQGGQNGRKAQLALRSKEIQAEIHAEAKITFIPAKLEERMPATIIPNRHAFVSTTGSECEN